MSFVVQHQHALVIDGGQRLRQGRNLMLAGLVNFT